MNRPRRIEFAVAAVLLRLRYGIGCFEPQALAASRDRESARSWRMSAARIIYPPMSGRDRRHFSCELREAEQEHARLVCEAEAAYAAADWQLADAHRFDCLAWSARLFIGGPDAPSPTIAAGADVLLPPSTCWQPMQRPENWHDKIR